jgi:hypothetical protein
MQHQQTLSTDPSENYARRLAARRADLSIRVRRHASVGNLRAIVFFAAVAMAFAMFTRQVFSGWCLLVPISAFWSLGLRLHRAESERTSFTRAVAFYERALARLNGAWAGTGETGERFLEERHLYAKDLDIFGRASLFELLCAARTPMGQTRLAGWLLEPAPPEIILARQNAVAELASRLDLREDLAVLADNVGAGVDTEALSAWGEREPLLIPSPFRAVVRGLSVLGVTALFALIAYLVAWLEILKLPEKTMDWLQIHFLSTGIIYTVVLWRFRKRTSRIIDEIDEAGYDLGLIAAVLRRIEGERFSSPRLAALHAELDTEGWPPSRRVAKLNRLIELVESRRHMAIAVIGPLLLWDIHLSYAIEDWRRVSGPAIRRWLNAVGEIEAISSLAGIITSIPAIRSPNLFRNNLDLRPKSWVIHYFRTIVWFAMTCIWRAIGAFWS